MTQSVAQHGSDNGSNNTAILPEVAESVIPVTPSSGISVTTPAVFAIQNPAILATALAAILYGLGFAVQYATNLELGIGPLTPSKESAVGAGIAFAMFLAPMYIVVWVCRMFSNALIKSLGEPAAEAPPVEPNPTEPPSRARIVFQLVKRLLLLLLIAAIAVLVTAVLQWGVITQVSSLHSTRPFLDGVSLFLVGSLPMDILVAIYLAFGTALAIRLEARSRPLLYIALAALVLPLIVQIYATSIAPYLSPTFGGYVLSEVREVDDKGKHGAPELLIAADTNYVVLASAEGPFPQTLFMNRFINRRQHPIPLIRKRWDAIKALEPAMPTPGTL